LPFPLQTFRANGFQVAVCQWRECSELWRRFLTGLFDDGQRVFAEKGRAACEQIKKNSADAIDISRESQLFRRALRLLRRDVAGCAEDGQRAREIARRIKPFAQAEIAHKRFATTVEQNISRLEVAMKDALDMRVLHCTRDLGHQSHDSARVIPKAPRYVLHASAGCKFHAEERQPVFGFAYFIDRQDVWMIETGGCLGFAPKTGKRFARVRVKAEDAFQRDDAARMSLTCPINDAHAAVGNFLQDLIIADPPIGVVDIDLIENSLQRLGSFSFAPEAAAKQTIQTRPAPDARGRSAFFTCHDIGVDSHRIGKIAHAHGWFMWWLLRELRIDTAAHHRYPPASPLFAPLPRVKDRGNGPAIGERVVSRTFRERPAFSKVFGKRHPGARQPSNRSVHQ